MGWSYEYKPHDVTTAEHIKDSLEYETENSKQEVLELRIVKLRTAYLAVKKTPPSGDPFVFGVVILLNFCPKSYFNLGMKVMDESEGPRECDCPAPILDKLTPLSDMVVYGYAAEWRKRCRKRLEERKNRLSIRKGMVVRTSTPVRFTDGSTHHVFKVLDGRKHCYARVYDAGRAGYRVHIPNIHVYGPVKEVDNS